jgi:hypothetical protein
MLTDAGGWEWLILFIYIIPVVVGYKAAMRLIKTIDSKFSKGDAEEEPQRVEARNFYGLIFIVPIVIFIIFIAFRIFAPGEIYSQNLQSQIFHGYWVYVMSAGIPLSLVGTVWGLRGLFQNSKSPWPILCVLGSFAVLFMISIFSVLLLLD